MIKITSHDINDTLNFTKGLKINLMNFEDDKLTLSIKDLCPNFNPFIQSINNKPN